MKLNLAVATPGCTIHCGWHGTIYSFLEIYFRVFFSLGVCRARSCHNFGNSSPVCVWVLWDENIRVMLRLGNVLIECLSRKYEKAV